MSKRRRRPGGLRLLAAFGALVALSAAPAQAEPRSLEVPSNAGWQHAETGLVLRARLAGYQRTALEDNGTAELDVTANFSAPNQSSVLTLYIFRPALMSVPVWFDRAETQILLRTDYRGARPVAEARAFAPPSATVASALRRTYLTGSDAHRATGLAMMPMSEWLVAVRISSRDGDPALLENRLDEVIGALGWPEGVEDAPPASLVADCAKPLDYAKRARLQKPNMTDALIGAVLAGMVAEQAEDEAQSDVRPVVFCRDAPGKSEYGVYRDAADPERESYVMALGDAGRIISVAPSLGAVISGSKGYMLTLGDLDQTLVYPSFDKLASPEAAFEAVSRAEPVSSNARAAGGGSTITIDSAAE